MSRALIRDDYYGGTLEVVGPDEPPDGFVKYNFVFRWEAGVYGSQELRLTWREALAMRDALSKALQAAGIGGEAVQATKGTEA